ncbi:hypothetical protein QE452_003248 [Sphingomonas sp. SORGH_AS438]|nr:hypothetical protein [Sphingomonas sp. SORGH_AS_0438]MDR6128584.1 hypothetical protein [Sphingomonas sp. SORGH_AS_0438]
MRPLAPAERRRLPWRAQRPQLGLDRLIDGEGLARGQAAGAEHVDRAEHVRIFHPDPRRAISPHRMADEAPALARRHGAVMVIDIADQVAGDERLEIAGRHRPGIHRPVMHRLRIGQHQDHRLDALREGPLHRLGDMDLGHPLLRTDRIAVQRIDDGIAAMARGGIAGRQDHDDVAVRRIPFQAALDAGGMDLDPLDRHRLRTGDHRRRVGADLGRARRRQAEP